MITECYDSLFLKAYYLQSRFNYRDEDEAADIVHDACAHCITKFDDFKEVHSRPGQKVSSLENMLIKSER